MKMEYVVLAIIGILAILYAFSPRAVNVSRSEEIMGKSIEEIVKEMTLGEKIGQMALVAEYAVKKEDIRRLGIGAVLSGGGGYPEPNTPESWRRMTDGFQKEALGSRTGIPLLYGVDAVHGHGNVRGAVIFPHNIGLGAAGDPGLVEETAAVTAREMLATGANWNFAPVLSIPLDMRWGRVYETFGSDPELVSKLGAAYVRGLSKEKVLATPKHFLGEGFEEWDTSKDYFLDQGDIRKDGRMLMEKSLEPFRAAIGAGALSIMVSRSSVDGRKMSEDKGLLTGTLKGRMGFEGFLVSDWGAIDQISEDDYYNAVTAINAGIDMVMIPEDYQKFISNVEAAVDKGDISEDRIDDAVRRILLAKKSAGLFSLPLTGLPDPGIVGGAEHRNLARQAVRESLVLLKNKGALPVKNGHKIAVAGQGADDIGLQSGGWTIEWQGKEGDITDGTTILGGLKSEFPESEIIFRADGKFAPSEKADTGIAVIAEKPYAEGVGDREDITVSESDLEIIRSVRENSRVSIIIILAGRPLVLPEQAMQADAIIMAWLPGTEGQGVAEVLSGKYGFKGRLPVDWPMSMPEAAKREKGSNLFAAGHGLGYPDMVKKQ